MDKKEKLEIKKSLKAFVEDEGGFVSKETILKVGLATVAGIGMIGMLGETANAGHSNHSSHNNIPPMDMELVQAIDIPATADVNDREFVSGGHSNYAHANIVEHGSHSSY